MTPHKAKCDGKRSLGELQTTVQQFEGVYGPLIALSNDGQDTILTFDTDASAPQNPCMLVPSGSPAPGSNYTIVCEGTCIVSANKTDITAYRQT
jgi:hypothetical protein